MRLDRVLGSFVMLAGMNFLWAQEQVNLTVDSGMDIYQAGGYADSSDGNPPVVFTFPSPAQGSLRITFPSVGGAWSCHGKFREYSADGQTSGSCLAAEGPTGVNAIGPFSGFHITDALGAMVGVFLSNETSATPPDLRFFFSDDSQGGIQTSFQSLSPQLGQIFFIGDGLTGTGTGALQTFQVPATATHLYLGYAGSCKSQATGRPGCFSSNTGSLDVLLQIESYKTDWVLPSVSVAPSARIGPSIAFDGSTHSTVLFGGSGAFIPGPTYGDTWEWRDGWKRVFPATSPPPRQAAGMAYDPTTGTIVLFGGWDNSNNGSAFGDTWIWDGVTWTQQFPPVSPPARNSRQAMAFDPVSNSVVLFGGIGSDTGEYGGNPFGDTWEWNGSTKTWTEVFPALSPSPRSAPLVYDTAENAIVLFGGDDGGGDCCRTFYNDTWTWDGTTWTQKFPAASPTARTYQMMAYDANLQEVVVFGGSSGPPVALNDTWAWNGTTWKNLSPPDQPDARYISSMDFDPISEGLVLFGGELTGDVVTNETWLFRLEPVKITSCRAQPKRVFSWIAAPGEDGRFRATRLRTRHSSRFAWRCVNRDGA